LGYINIVHSVNWIGDREWYRQFIISCQNAGTENPESILFEDGNEDQIRFFENALLGYQRYLYLITKYPDYVENIMFSPIPAIDLIWHTHLLQPESYYKDCMILMNEVRHHKLLPDYYDKTWYNLEERTNNEEKLWYEEFSENMSRYSMIKQG